MKRIICVLFALSFMLSALNVSAKEINEYVEYKGKTYSADLVTFGNQAMKFDMFKYYFTFGLDRVSGGDDSFWENADSSLDSMVKEIKDWSFEQLKYNLYPYIYEEIKGTDYKEKVQADVAKRLSQTVGKKTEEEFRTYLEEHEMTEDLLKRIIECELLNQAIYEDLYDTELAITDEEFTRLVGERYYCMYDYQVVFGDDPEGAKAEAEAFLASIPNNVTKEQFYSLTQTDSNDDSYMKDNKDGMYFIKGDVDANIFDAVAELKEGEVSKEVILSSAGYHVVMRLPIDYDYVEERRAIQFENSIVLSLYYDYMDDLANSVEIKYSDLYALINPVSINEMVYHGNSDITYFTGESGENTSSDETDNTSKSFMDKIKDVSWQTWTIAGLSATVVILVTVLVILVVKKNK